MALSAVNGKISDPRNLKGAERFPFGNVQSGSFTIEEGDVRRHEGVWDYSHCNNLNTDQMFAGNLTYKVQSSDPGEIIPHLFEGFDPMFAKELQSGDIIMGGENFGCGSSREHPSVGLAQAGVKAVIVKSPEGVSNCAAFDPSPNPVFPWQEAQCFFHNDFPILREALSGLMGLGKLLNFSGTGQLFAWG